MASEIDDFPAAVTGHHFPNVKQMGDITKIKAEDLEPVDIICAGSPCQDLSVAGKREGLSGERSGLFKTAIKLVHELRKQTGKPRYFVWENVQGAFSSNKGMDFREVLEEISQTEIPIPQGGKWAEAGMVEWGRGSLAWRVLDAQYWGVPQRRKRIFLVADFGGNTAGEILFECQGLSEDSTESQGTGEETAGNAGKGVDSASGIAYSFNSLASNSMKSKNPHNGCRQVEVSKTLDTTRPDPSKNQGGIAILNYQNKEVRRLTPTECERLQGLPDGYTDIEFKGKPASDSRRYKALGNGMAQPCADYVIRRIQEIND